MDMPDSMYQKWSHESTDRAEAPPPRIATVLRSLREKLVLLERTLVEVRLGPFESLR